LLDDAPRLDHFLNTASQQHFDSVRRYLDAAEIPAIINPRLVRGLDYYGHTTFEFITDALGAQGTVMAGGRYDGLAAMLGGGDVSGVGWAAGIERLAMLADVPSAPAVDVMMIGMSDNHMARLFPLAVSLRQEGMRVETGYAPQLGKQMKRADRIAARQVVILGDDEAARGVAILRSMADGEQTEIALTDLVAQLLAQHKGQ